MTNIRDNYFESIAERDEFHAWLESDREADYYADMEYHLRPFDVRCDCGVAATGSQADLEKAGWQLGRKEFCPTCVGN